jgi:hypothetical protein
MKIFLALLLIVSSNLSSYENLNFDDKYEILDEKCSTFVVEIKAHLIKEKTTGLYSVYIVSYFDDIKRSIDKAKPIPLEHAQKIFPDWDIFDANYGAKDSL